MTSAELPGGKKGDAGVEPLSVQTIEELDRHFEGTYGKDKLAIVKASLYEQSGVLDGVDERVGGPSLREIREEYRLHAEAIAQKETLLGTVWRYTTNTVGFATDVVTAPFRWTWHAFTNYPVMTTLGIAALALGGTAAYLYYAGKIEEACAALGVPEVGKYFGAFKDAAQPTVDTPIVPGGGEAGIPGGTVAPSAPTTRPL